MANITRSSDGLLRWNGIHVCEICMDDMSGKRAAARYCSAKCKQAGYRKEKSDREGWQRFLAAKGL